MAGTVHYLWCELINLCYTYKGGDFIKIVTKVYHDYLDYALSNADRQRIINKPYKRNAECVGKYIQACAMAKRIFSPPQGKVTFDDPEMPFYFHHIAINLDDTDFDENRLRDFVNLLNLSDGMSIFGKENLQLILQVHNLYEEL